MIWFGMRQGIYMNITKGLFYGKYQTSNTMPVKTYADRGDHNGWFEEFYTRAGGDIHNGITSRREWARVGSGQANYLE